MLLTLDNYTLQIIFSYLNGEDYRNLISTCSRINKLTCTIPLVRRFCKKLRRSFQEQFRKLTYESKNTLILKLTLKCISHILTLGEHKSTTSEIELLINSVAHTGKNTLYLQQNGFNVQSFNFWYNFQLSRNRYLILCSIDFKSRISDEVSEGVVAIVHDDVFLSEDIYFYNTRESNKLKSLPIIKPRYKDEYRSHRTYSEGKDVLEPVCGLLQESLLLEEDFVITPQVLCNFMKRNKRIEKRLERSDRLILAELQSVMEEAFVKNISDLELPCLHKSFLNNLKTMSSIVQDPAAFITNIINDMNDVLESLTFL